MEPDILFVLCDTARADAFEPWGGRVPTPNVDALAGTGTTYERAVAQAPWTLPSTASMFTGELPTEHGVSAETLAVSERAGDAAAPGELAAVDSGAPTAPQASPAVRSLSPLIEQRKGTWLPRDLVERGYETWGVSCNPWISRWNGFATGFQAFTDVRPRAVPPRGRAQLAAWRLRQAYSGRDHGGREAIQGLMAWLGDNRRRPWFAFMNLMELHDPYDPPRRLHPLVGGDGRGARWRRLPSWVDRQVRQRTFRGRPDELYLRVIRDLYGAAAMYTDRLLGQVMGRVAEWNRPVAVVLVSDHGEMLGEHGLFEHHSSLHEPLLHVPLAVSGHRLDLAGGAVGGPIAVSGLARWAIGLAEGRVEPLGPDGPVASEYESTVRRPGGIAIRPDLVRAQARGSLPPLARSPGLAVRDGDLKFVAVEGEPDQLYDLAIDPREERDLASGADPRVEAFLPHRAAWDNRRARISSHADRGPVVEDEIADHLRSLGYLE
jgi:arylsulfatase A-like enzyme